MISYQQQIFLFKQNRFFPSFRQSFERPLIFGQMLGMNLFEVKKFLDKNLLQGREYRIPPEVYTALIFTQSWTRVPVGVGWVRGWCMSSHFHYKPN